MTYTNNKSNARKSLQGRMRYDKILEEYAPLMYGDDQLLKIWSSASQKYGRTDLSNQVVYPNETRMKHYDNALVFDFVAECLDEMKTYINISITSETLDPSVGSLFPLKIQSGYRDVHAEHASYMQVLINSFYREMVNTGATREIINYKDFESRFLEHIRKQPTGLIFTKNQYHSSKHGSPMMSGLFVETKVLAHDNDRAKVSLITDSNFPYFVETARRHGFFVDKNAPWRLVVDIRSCYIRNKLKARGVDNLIRFFEIYYSPSHETEIATTTMFFKEMWNSYCTAEPSIDQVTYTDSGPTLSLHKRSKIEDLTHVPRRSWAKSYIRIRTEELLGEYSPGYVTDLLSEIEKLLERPDWQKKVGEHIETQLMRKKYKKSLTKASDIYTIVDKDCPDVVEPIEVEPEMCEITDDKIIPPTISDNEEGLPTHIEDEMTGQLHHADHALHSTPAAQSATEENERNSEIEELGTPVGNSYDIL